MSFVNENENMFNCDWKFQLPVAILFTLCGDIYQTMVVFGKFFSFQFST